MVMQYEQWSNANCLLHVRPKMKEWFSGCWTQGYYFCNSTTGLFMNETWQSFVCFESNVKLLFEPKILLESDNFVHILQTNRNWIWLSQCHQYTSLLYWFKISIVLSSVFFNVPSEKGRLIPLIFYISSLHYRQRKFPLHHRSHMWLLLTIWLAA